MRAIASSVGKLKAVATNATVSSNQYMRSPQDAESGKSGLATRFFNTKRRATESLMQAAGKAKAVEDPEFDSRKKRFTDLDGQVEAMFKSLNSYLSASQSMSTFAADGFGAIRAIDAIALSSGRPSGASMTAEGRLSAVSSFDTFRATHDRRFLTEVLDPLTTLKTTVADIKVLMRERELVKLDYDARVRKLKLIKESTTADPRKVLHKEDKTRRTAEMLADLTARLYTRMEEWEANVMDMVGPIARSTDSLMRAYFEEGSRVFGPTVSGPLTTTGAVMRPMPVVGAVGSSASPSKLPGFPASSAAAAAGGAGGGGGIAAGFPVSSGSSRTVAASGLGSSRILASKETSASSLNPTNPLPPSAPVVTRAAPAYPPRAAEDKVRAQYAYSSTKPDELNLALGDEVVVLQRFPDGWCKGRKVSDGKEGVFPENYTQKI